MSGEQACHGKTFTLLAKQEVLYDSGNIGSCVILLEKDNVWLLLGERKYSRTENLINLPPGIQISVYDNEWRPLMSHDPSPNHDNTST